MLKSTKFLFFLLLSFTIFTLQAQNRHALLIGIDEYQPEGVEIKTRVRWSNLDGCVNDIIAINELIINKFGFKENEITVLTNVGASRDSILFHFDRLTKKAKKGDNVFFYYAGHGSQVKNSLSSEDDKRDETIVPSDSYKGTQDIRDKEIATVFDKIVENGSILTAIFDCCHSGSIARGVMDNEPDKLRMCLPNENDVKDAGSAPRPEEKGALIISASQDDEAASEYRGTKNNPHGAFTYAFLQTMNNLPATASAEQVFLSIRSIVKYLGKRQEPVIAGTEDRLKSNLMGMAPDNIPRHTQVAVIKSHDEDEIIIQSGYVSGLNVGSQIFHVAKNDTITLEIIEVEELNKSTAKLVQGNFKEIKPGMMFQVLSYASPDYSTLNIHIPNTIDKKTVTDFATDFIKWSNENNINNISNPFTDSPDFFIFHQNGKWIVNNRQSERVLEESGFGADKFSSAIPENSKVFISIPASEEMTQSLRSGNSSGLYTFDSEINTSDYIFGGRINGDKLEYGFFHPYIEENSQDNDFILPLITDFYNLDESSSNFKDNIYHLNDICRKLGKVKKWLTMQAPIDDGSFPFVLQLVNRATNESAKKHSVIGQRYDLVMKMDESMEDDYDGIARYVHVFIIDATGQMQAIYPLSSVENKFPKYNNHREMITEYKLLRNIAIDDPLGYDTFIMLASTEQIPNFRMLLNQSGVLTRGSDGGLAELFNDGVSTRGVSFGSSSWYMKRLTIKSVEQE